MRGGRAFLVLTAYLLLLSGGVGLILLTYSASGITALQVDSRQVLGKSIFGLVFSLQLLTVCFVAPAITAGTISGEREGQTIDLLQVSLLSPSDIIVGKLSANISFLILLLVTSLPLQSLAYLFGGVTYIEILISTLILLVTTLAFSALGLFFSALSPRTLISTVLSYAVTTLLVFGIPILFTILAALIGPLIGNIGNRLSLLAEIALLTGGMFLVSVNPIATAIVSEVILLQEHSAVYYQLPISNGALYPILSPWISYSALYLLVSLILVRLGVRHLGGGRR